ncbi:hypothetical protein A6R68_13145, partial [Neotoma lepida]
KSGIGLQRKQTPSNRGVGRKCQGGSWEEQLRKIRVTSAAAFVLRCQDVLYVDDVISRIDRMFPEMSIHLSRPNGTSAMLLVTLGKVLKVIVVMRSLFIDRTIVKGYNENVYTEDGKLDIWSKSNYQVFQKQLGRNESQSAAVHCIKSLQGLEKGSNHFDLLQALFQPSTKPAGSASSLAILSGALVLFPGLLHRGGRFYLPEEIISLQHNGSNPGPHKLVTDHATTALLHYQLPQMPDVVVRSFMTWLRSYIKLFQAPCQRCGKFLQDGLPPTWRDFRTLEAFHDTCRQ